MAKATKSQLSYEWDGLTLVVSADDTILRRFDFSRVAKHDAEFIKLGRKTKLINFAASAKDEGRDRLDMMDDGWQQLLDGRWEKEREGGGPTVSPNVEALAKLKKTSVAAIQKALRNYDEETRKAILTNPEVVKVAEKIKAERESAAVSLDDLA